MASKRKSEISYLNVLLCILVVMIHILSFAVSGFEMGSVKFNLAMFPWRLISFVVQGFILLSGVKLFLTKKDEYSYGRYLLLRIKTVILPYIFCFAVYYVMYFVVYDYPLDIKFMLDHLIHGSLVYHLYFIVLLFQFDLLFPLWKRVINKCPAVIIIPFSIVITSICEFYLPTIINMQFPNYAYNYNDRTFTTFLCFWIIGCYIGKHYDAFNEMLKKNFKTILGVFIIALIPFLYYTYISYNGIAYIPFMNQLHTLYAMCVILVLYALAIRLPETMPGLISKIDTASFDIYLWHVMVLFRVNFIIERIGLVSQILAFGFRVILVYGITIPVCILMNVVKGAVKKRIKHRKQTQA